MTHVQLIGAVGPVLDVARGLISQGHRVSIEGVDFDRSDSVVLRREDVVLAAGETMTCNQQDVSPSAHGIQGEATPHLQAVASLAHSEASPQLVRRRTLRAGESIHLSEGLVGEIVDGIVVMSVIHMDGAEVIIGFLGKGDFIVPHPTDTCHVQPSALSDATIDVFRWGGRVDNRDYALAMSSRVLRAEAWAAAQAHPYIEQRVYGILHLLAEQFGVPHEGGLLISCRVTHGQLASMTGATRPTVTRVLAQLRRSGFIEPFGSGSSQRFCVFEQGVRATGDDTRHPSPAAVNAGHDLNASGFPARPATSATQQEK
jgi:CRP-like cAMP-binding protein